MRGWLKFIILLCLISLNICYAVPNPDTNQNDEHQASFLVISDIHLNHHSQHAMDFAPKQTTINNDLDVATYEQLIDKIRDDIQSGEIEDPQFIILLGDLAGHIRHSQQDVVNNERIVMTTMKAAFPNTPIFYNFGNNDSLTADYGLFRSPDVKSEYRSPLDLIKSVWPQGLFLSTGKVCKYHHTYPCLIKTNTSNGYYSAYLKPHFRLISLNTVMFSDKQRGYTNLNILDQLQWLEHQLKEVEESHETALLVMHVPPGDNIYKAHFWSETAFWSYDEVQKFNQLIRDYRLSITGILAAHTHKDEVKLMGMGGVAIAGVYLNPALSTSHGNAPAVRSYVLNRAENTLRWDLSDYRTYFFARNANGAISSRLLYRFQEYYCTKNETKRMSDCWDKVTIDKVKHYLGAGNPSFQEEISEPQNIHILSKKTSLHAQFRTWLG
ncbi:MAG: metallophosphoesterase [Legionellaceae bacterium]|nr:metallophosphoesterase [Legionellaceae bacterium]